MALEKLYLKSDEDNYEGSYGSGLLGLINTAIFCNDSSHDSLVKIFNPDGTMYSITTVPANDTVVYHIDTMLNTDGETIKFSSSKTNVYATINIIRN